jgi:hypothetical protein
VLFGCNADLLPIEKGSKRMNGATSALKVGDRAVAVATLLGATAWHAPAFRHPASTSPLIITSHSLPLSNSRGIRFPILSGRGHKACIVENEL